MSMSQRTTGFLILLSRRSDLVIAAVVLTAVAMMIIPLPTWLVDILITINIAISMLVMLVAFSIVRPIEFSSLPSVILVSTLFRLSITITTSRLILLQADAGEIITAFGAFVVGGMVTVGLILFLIITIAQFLVITKGAERVAEVAARFALDALPGKQLSIDGDARNGTISQAEAVRQRSLLQRESQLYGAMDGAMKFVKGDAIAGLVIILVNLLGGLLVGVFNHGMSLSDAVGVYSLLTVGDGLVAQIPALLVSVGAGAAITRVESEMRADLGADIARQLANPQALLLGAPIMLALAFTPGFPTPVFLTMAVIFGVGGYIALLRNRIAGAAAPVAQGGPALSARGDLSATSAPGAGPGPAAPRSLRGVIVWVGSELALQAPPEAFRERAAAARTRIVSELGIKTPDVELFHNPAIAANRFRFDLDGVPVMDGEIPAGRLLVDDDPVYLEMLAIPLQEGPVVPGRRRAVWVDASWETALSHAGVRFLSPLDLLDYYLARMLKRYAAQFVGIQEVRQLLEPVEAEFPDLVRETQKTCTLQKMTDILRRLVEEDVSVRNLRAVMEAVIEWSKREEDTVLLVEYVRTGLAREICYRYAGADRVIMAYVLERSLEVRLRSAIRPTGVGAFLTISEEVARPVVEPLRKMLSGAPGAVQPVVLTTMDLRRHVSNLLKRNNIEAPVLSYQELAPEFGVLTLAVIQAETAVEDMSLGGLDFRTMAGKTMAGAI